MRQFQSKSFRFRFSKNFADLGIPLRDLNEAWGNKIGKRNFCFALRLCIYRIFVALQESINLNLLQRLNEAYPDHSFYSAVVRRGTNPSWRAWRLRNIGAEAV